MGFEHFRIELRGGHAAFRDADEAIRQVPTARPDADSVPLRGSAYFLIGGANHVIEVEIMDSPVRLSCRFTLCHPPSIDAVFLDLVRDLMGRLGMEATIRDDVRPEDVRPFSLVE